MKYLRRIYYSVKNTSLSEQLLLVVFVLFFLGPLTNLFVDAFRENHLAKEFIPREVSMRWFNFIFQRDEILSAFASSYVIAITTTVVSLIICLPAAYALARFDFPFKKFFLFSFLLSNAFPKIGLYVSMGVIFYRMNLMGTFLGVLIVHVMNSLMLMTWISSTAFKSVHKQQEEAARDVGAGPMRTFFSVTFPLAFPGIAAASLFTFLGSLEEGQGTLLVGFPRYKTIPTVMYGVIFDYPGTAGAAFSLLYIVPIIILLTIVAVWVKKSSLFNNSKTV